MARTTLPTAAGVNPVHRRAVTSFSLLLGLFLLPGISVAQQQSVAANPFTTKTSATSAPVSSMPPSKALNPTPANKEEAGKEASLQAVEMASTPAPASSAGLPTPPAQAPLPLPPLPTQADQTKLYQGSLYKTMALTPSQILQLKKMLNDRNKALSTLPVPPPKPSDTTVSVSLQPGSVPPLIRPFTGEVTAFVVVDSSGEPWPVSNFVVGNSSLFSVQRLDGAKGSAFAITANSMYGQSNLVLKLEGLTTPVVVDMLAGQPVQDSTVRVRIEHLGPNAPAAAENGLPPGVSSSLLPVADGIAPPGGTALNVVGDPNTEVWALPNGHMLVRTPLTILSPAALNFFSSPDGMHVYMLPKVPLLTCQYNLRFLYLHINLK